jgi:hypothetical protein
MLAMNKFLDNKKTLLFILASFFVVVELVWGINYLKTVPQPSAPAEAETGALLGFSPAQKIVKVGEEFEVELTLDTKGVATSGTDVIINYDPTAVEVLNVRSGLLYQKYPLNEIDAASGKIGFSGVAEPPKTFSGRGTLAYLKLKALKAGTAALSIQFEKEATTDSNVVRAGSGGEDVLDKVINAYYSVKD